MSYAAERAVIRVKFQAAAVAVYGSAPLISWDAFNGSEYAPTIGTAYCRPRIEDGEAEWAATTGSTKKQFNSSTLIVEVYEPAETGDNVGNQRADGFIAAFKDYSSGGVRFSARGFQKYVGDDSGFAKWMVFLPYYREENL